VAKTLELSVSTCFGRRASWTVDVREAIGQPCVRRLALCQRRDVQDLQLDEGGPDPQNSHGQADQRNDPAAHYGNPPPDAPIGQENS
jgi:hypothetical protein